MLAAVVLKSSDPVETAERVGTQSPIFAPLAIKRQPVATHAALLLPPLVLVAIGLLCAMSAIHPTNVSRSSVFFVVTEGFNHATSIAAATQAGCS